MTKPLVAGLILIFLVGGGLAVPVMVGALVAHGALRVVPAAMVVPPGAGQGH